MKKTVTTRNAAPVYAIAVVWLIGTFLVGVHSIGGYLVLAALSVAAFLIGRKLWPDTVEEVEAPEPEPADPELAALKKERDRAISEIRRLNDNIADPGISRQIDHIEATTRKIFDYILEMPEKKGQVRTFLNYYLPTTIKLLNEYDRMDNLGVSGANIDSAKRKIEGMLDTICVAFDKQLDALFSDTAMDVSAEITVLEQMMQQQGLSGSGMGGV
ncbi:MAG: 5-bromo-4-chloroindolyl phosphate hydrolysis family protein [Clostridiales bacterium]|nr:5-bromo-4-chloroindolyl phosphate hydrolysis family protein [Clostridiales bacterium]